MIEPGSVQAERLAELPGRHGLAQEIALPLAAAEPPTISLAWWQEQPLILLGLPLPNGQGRLLAGQRLDPVRLLDELHIAPGAELQLLPPDNETLASGTSPASSPVPAILARGTGVESTAPSNVLTAI